MVSPVRVFFRFGLCRMESCASMPGEAVLSAQQAQRGSMTPKTPNVYL